MAGILLEIKKLCDLLSTVSDPRSKSLPILTNTYQVLGVIILYVLFIYIWGPKLMKNREPFKLDRFIMIYNAIQIIACAYLCIRGLLIWAFRFRLLCEPVDLSDSPAAWEVIYLCYNYFFLKMFDLFDTVFFVLRKKFNQITFLHVYHHAGMVLLSYGALMLVPGGHGTLVGVINSFVHCIMYAYYFLTIYNPEVNNIWWKKYVTKLQIVQFFLYVVHMGSILVTPNCEYPKWTAVIFVPQNIFMLILFTDFYVKAYIIKPKMAMKEKIEDVYENLTTSNQTDIDRIMINEKTNDKLYCKNKHEY